MHSWSRLSALMTVAIATAVVVSPSGAYAVLIEVGSASGAPGSTVTVPITLRSQGSPVGGTQADIGFEAATPITGCTVSPPFAGLSGVTLQPTGCTPGTDCEFVRAVILRLSFQPIPDGSVLYTCNVQIAATAAPGSYPLMCSNASASTPDGVTLTTECPDSAIEVLAITPTTPTPTPTATPTATATPTPTKTATEPPGSGGGSCQISPSRRNAAWLPLIPVSLLVIGRRRIRRHTAA